MIYCCLHFKLYCHFFKAFGGLAQEIVPCSECVSLPCLHALNFVLAEHLLLLGFAHRGFWGDCSCIQGSTVWLMRVWSCAHCFIFVLLQGYSQGIELCEARLPMLNLLLSHWGCLRGHVIVGQPNGNRLHTSLLRMAARRGMQVSVCCCWTGFSYCLLSPPWQSRNKLRPGLLYVPCPVQQDGNSVMDSFLRDFFSSFVVFFL